MRIIKLHEDEEQARSQFGIYASAAFGGQPPKDLKGFRDLGKLQDAIEEISDEEEAAVQTPQGVATQTFHKLHEGITEFRLEDAAWELLKSRIFGAGVDWRSSAARRVTAAYDALEEAEVESVTKRQKEEKSDES